MGTLGTKPRFESPLNTAFEAYERRKSRLQDIGFDNSAQRMELRYRLENLQQNLDRLQSSIGALGDSSIDGSPKKARGRRKKLQSSVFQDFGVLKAQLDSLTMLSDELRASDRRQEQAEESFDNAAAAIVASLRRSDACVPRDLVEDQSVRTLQIPICSLQHPTSSPQSPIPCELGAYYHSVSTLRNMHERVSELQLEQQEQWKRRGVMADQGQVLDQSDGDFLRSWEEILSVANRDFGQAQRDVAFARKSCENAGIVIPAWVMVNTGEQQNQDNAVRINGDLPSRDGSEAEQVYLTRFESWYKSRNGPLKYPGIKDDPPIPNMTSAWGQCLSDVRKKRPCNPSRLARWCSPLVAAMVPLVNATINESTTKEVLSTVTDLGGLQSLRNDQNAVREVMSTASQYMLAILPPLILLGGTVVSAWTLTREKREFERQRFLFLMTFTATVSWWVLAATGHSGENGGPVSISTWLALIAIYTSRNHRGLRNGTSHVFVTFLGGLTLTSLLALALLPAKEASMEGFIRTSLTVGPSVVTLWSWLAARSQWQLEGSVDAVVHETIELQGSTNTVPQ